MNIDSVAQILGVVWVIRHSSLLEWLRAKTAKWTLPREFFNCAFCAAFWAKVGIDVVPVLAKGGVPATPDIITTIWHGVGFGAVSLLAFSVYDWLKSSAAPKVAKPEKPATPTAPATP